MVQAVWLPQLVLKNVRRATGAILRMKTPEHLRSIPVLLAQRRAATQGLLHSAWILPATSALLETTVKEQTLPRLSALQDTSVQLEPCMRLSFPVQQVGNQLQERRTKASALLARQERSVPKEVSSSTIAHPAQSARQRHEIPCSMSVRMASIRLATPARIAWLITIAQLVLLTL